ncbi:DUF4286 family protein [Spirosoma utsteinense]|uniref:DUF4286 domain-containing protein n=1 Tax=Spirosoma utsteinense TaxID=2585773 RepID=A0ABR6WBD7_9BACT|nr:DUF4286 family protein [Spirosoma utsteinense]MBC3784057.1 hypothetical protein [Spirosoma utsteinense]MBC3793453.1 hypothetical protein [Spirosoma utsteinense]
MILYNTTYSVALETGPDWLRWMKTFQLPAIMATGLPTGHKIRRLLTELDNGGVTYSVQIDFATLDDYETYQQNHANALQQRIQHRFGGQFVFFDTLLEEV